MYDELHSSDWDIVKALLPSDWEESARQCGALRRCRKVDNAETLLRLILLHVAGGLSLHQTAVRAGALGWANLTDAALAKRLRSSANWLEYLCSHLWSHQTWPAGLEIQGKRWRIVDATTVQEPGAVGTDWRVHYVVQLPILACDYVSVTSARGGESFCRIPVRAGDVMLADRGYSHRPGVGWVLSQGGDVIVRHQGPNFPLLDRRGHPFDLLRALRRLRQHQPGTWPVQFEAEEHRWPVWLHGVRKSVAAAERAKKRLREEHGKTLQPETLELAEYVAVLASLAPARLSVIQALGLYRGRWQIELVFKILKSLLGMGELAKYDEDAARAWLQAKLLTALLIERLEREARFFSPWGYPLLGTIQLAPIPRSARQSSAGNCSRPTSAQARGRGRQDRAKALRTPPPAPTPGETIN